MQKRYNASQLKLAAMGLMLLDHSYKVFRGSIFNFFIQHTAIPENVLIWVMELIGLFGALSFWIFAYFIAEGCRFTHNRKAYMFRLLLAGLVSEVPFQFMICIIMGKPLQLHVGATNIFFTLLLGAIAIYGYDRCKRMKKHNWLRFLPLVACMGSALLLQTDYSFIGVAAIFVCYTEKKKSRLRNLSIIILLETALLTVSEGVTPENTLFAFLYCGYALLSIPLLSLYNGEKGNITKWLFYLFYPLHIFIIVLIYAVFIA